MIEINVQSVVDGLSAIIAEQGEDFVYQPLADRGCVYVKDGQPDCIVGRYLASVGVPLERLSYADREAVSGGMGALGLVSNLRNEKILAADHESALILSRIQRFQDEGIAWGEAFDRATVSVLVN